MATPSNPAAPCHGLRVLDFTSVVSGPFCTQVLGDYGADVVKVESLIGDMSRSTSGPFHAGLSGFFSQFNRNKRSIALDLKSPAGREVVLRLARESDVVVENFRPDVMDRLGMGDGVLRAANPRLIYVSISGFGPDGPYAPLPAYDHVVQGLAGMMPAQGAGGAPQMFRTVVADKAAGMTALAAVLAALFARERGGNGQRIDVPMLDAYAAFVLPELMGPISFPDSDSGIPPFDLFRVYPTADGHVVGMVVQDAQFAGLCEFLERDDLKRDPRFVRMAERFQNIDTLSEILLEEFRKRPTEALIAGLRRSGAPFAPVNNFEAFLSDEQVEHSGVVRVIEDPRARVRVLRAPARFSETPAVSPRRPPLLGEHTDAILALAGHSPGEIAELREQGVVV
ncbi:MAG TPA: CoA transferase [Myxococcales bacterium]|nr:CoA transferase [Myxococcales bacterium]